MGKISNFTDLNSWKSAHALTMNIYRTTKSFPKEELFGITSQLRRSSSSIAFNIAEGFGRKTPKDKMHFYNMALSSLRECHSQILLCRDLEYIDNETYNSIIRKIDKTGRLITGLSKSAQHTTY